MLYAAMGYASHLAYKASVNAPLASTRNTAKKGLTLYWVQLGLNMAWTPLFFGMQPTGLGFGLLGGIWGTVVALTVSWKPSVCLCIVCIRRLIQSEVAGDSEQGRSQVSPL